MCQIERFGVGRYGFVVFGTPPERIFYTVAGKHQRYVFLLFYTLFMCRFFLLKVQVDFFSRASFKKDYLVLIQYIVK